LELPIIRQHSITTICFVVTDSPVNISLTLPLDSIIVYLRKFLLLPRPISVRCAIVLVVLVVTPELAKVAIKLLKPTPPTLASPLTPRLSRLPT